MLKECIEKKLTPRKNMTSLCYLIFLNLHFLPIAILLQFSGRTEKSHTFCPSEIPWF